MRRYAKGSVAINQCATANQMPTMTIAATMTLHTIGVTRFELPLRGESLAAWLNSFCIATDRLKRTGPSGKPP